MRSKRPIILMAVLLLLLVVYVLRPWWERSPYSVIPLIPEAALPGKNEVKTLNVHRDATGRWMATFDYFYTGAPAGTYLNLRLGRAEHDGTDAENAARMSSRARTRST